MATHRLDHLNLRIPEDGVEAALEFYGELLGLDPFKLEAFRAGDRTSFFLRIGDTSVLNLRPVDAFEPPGGGNFDHYCLVLDDSMARLRRRLEAHGVEVQREGTPLGATGRAPAVYVRDPFGYTVELRALQDDEPSGPRGE